MTTSQIRFQTCQQLYFQERSRREEIRHSIATPVAALAFSIFNLSVLGIHYNIDYWDKMPGIAIAILSFFGLFSLVAAAILVIRTEIAFFYFDPPDLRELVKAEKKIEEQSDFDNSKNGNQKATVDEYKSRQLQNLLAAAYDIGYRRYLAANERAARDRTRGLHLIIFALLCFAFSLVLLPVQQAGVL